LHLDEKEITHSLIERLRLKLNLFCSFCSASNFLKISFWILGGSESIIGLYFSAVGVGVGVLII
jgi:hypothetical protein